MLDLGGFVLDTHTVKGVEVTDDIVSDKLSPREMIEPDELLKEHALKKEEQKIVNSDDLEALMESMEPVAMNVSRSMSLNKHISAKE